MKHRFVYYPIILFMCCSFLNKHTLNLICSKYCAGCYDADVDMIFSAFKYVIARARGRKKKVSITLE